LEEKISVGALISHTSKDFVDSANAKDLEELYEKAKKEPLEKFLILKDKDAFNKVEDIEKIAFAYILNNVLPYAYKIKKVDGKYEVSRVLGFYFGPFEELNKEDIVKGAENGIFVIYVNWNNRKLFFKPKHIKEYVLYDTQKVEDIEKFYEIKAKQTMENPFLDIIKNTKLKTKTKINLIKSRAAKLKDLSEEGVEFFKRYSFLLLIYNYYPDIVSQYYRQFPDFTSFMYNYYIYSKIMPLYEKAFNGEDVLYDINVKYLLYLKGKRNGKIGLSVLERIKDYDILFSKLFQREELDNILELAFEYPDLGFLVEVLDNKFRVNAFVFHKDLHMKILIKYKPCEVGEFKRMVNEIVDGKNPLSVGEIEKMDLKEEKEKKTIHRCVFCNKVTNSHVLETGEYVCHSCWVANGLDKNE
jgi:hypothetical protein